VVICRYRRASGPSRLSGGRTPPPAPEAHPARTTLSANGQYDPNEEPRTAREARRLCDEELSSLHAPHPARRIMRTTRSAQAMMRCPSASGGRDPARLALQGRTRRAPPYRWAHPADMRSVAHAPARSAQTRGCEWKPAQRIAERSTTSIEASRPLGRSSRWRPNRMVGLRGETLFLRCKPCHAQRRRRRATRACSEWHLPCRRRASNSDKRSSRAARLRTARLQEKIAPKCIIESAPYL
jgi:hypothetical protein